MALSLRTNCRLVIVPSSMGHSIEHQISPSHGLHSNRSILLRCVIARRSFMTASYGGAGQYAAGPCWGFLLITV